jgi:hypothetical protein
MFVFSRTRKLVCLTISVSMLWIIGCGSGQQFGLNPDSQSFGQVITYNKQVDLLIVIDTSGSMAQKQSQLSSQFYPFIDYLVKSGFDFHVAVTTMDMSSGGAQGAFVGSPKVLTSQTPNIQQAFVANVSQGNKGSDLSRGLLSMQTALSDNLLNSKNTGFFRSSALLAVVFLSDEDDGSTGSSQSFTDFLNQLKPPFAFGAKGWVANSIVVPSMTDQCKTYNQFSSPGARYMALSTASSGTVESICTPDLVQASSDIRERITSMLTIYHIDRPADTNSIKVLINGASVPNNSTNGWTFDIASNNITFHGTAIPEANSNVQVSYQPLTAKT